MPKEKLSLALSMDYGKRLYDVCWLKKSPDDGIKAASVLLRKGRITFEELMRRVKAQAILFQKSGRPKDKRPYFATWLRRGGWYDEDVVAFCAAPHQLQAMFDTWHKDNRAELGSIDRGEAMYVWLSAGVAKDVISKDDKLKAYANKQWLKIRQRYRAMQATDEIHHRKYKLPGECTQLHPSLDVLAAIERLKCEST